MTGYKLILSFIGIGVLTGCIVALLCMAITIIAANPWIPILGLAALYGVTGALVSGGVL